MGERAAPWMAAVLVSLPVLAGGYPPMNDLPDHEEIVAAMRFFHDASRYPPGLLTWNLGQPNQLFYYLAWLLSWLVPVRLACKIVVLGSLAGVPLGAARLARHLGRSRWIAVVVAPLALGLPFEFGLVGNLLGFGLLLALLPSVDRLAAHPTARDAAIATASLLLLYAAHESMFTMAWLAVVVAVARRRSTVRTTVWRLSPSRRVVAPSPKLVAHVRAMSGASANLTRLPQWIDMATFQKVDQMPRVLFGLYGEHEVRPVFVCLCASLALLAIFHAPRFATDLFGPGSLPARLVEERFLLLAIALVVAYFEVPFSINGAFWINGRFLAPAVAVGALALAPRLPRRLPSVLVLAAFVSLGAALALVRPALEASASVYATSSPLLGSDRARQRRRSDRSGARTALEFRVQHRRRGGTGGGRARRADGGLLHAELPHSGGRHRARAPLERGARAHRRRPFLVRARARPPAVPLRADLDLRSSAGDDDLAQALAPEATLVARSGGWVLFESRGPVLPLLSPEPPHVRTASLRARLEVLRQVREARQP